MLCLVFNNGLTLQWGRCKDASTYTIITFPITFKSVSKIFVYTPGNLSTQWKLGYNLHWWYDFLTITKITLGCSTGSNLQTFTGSWICFGY